MFRPPLAGDKLLMCTDCSFRLYIRHLRDFVYNISRTMINCWVFLSSKMTLNLFLVAAPWCSTTIVLSQQEGSGFEPADLLEPFFVAFACFSCVCGFWTKECLLGCDPKCICNCGCESVGLSTDPPLWHSCKQEKWMDVEFLTCISLPSSFSHICNRTLRDGYIKKKISI